MSWHPNSDLQTNLVHNPQTDIVTQRLICTQLLSKSRDISFHPNTDLHKTWFTIQRHIFVAQRLICTKAWFTILSPKDCFMQTNLILNPETYISCHSKTDLYTKMNHNIHRQNLLITQILTCNTNLIHNSRCKSEERQYLQRNRPPHKFVKTLTSSGKEIEVYPGKPKLGFSVSRLTWSTY
jgi:hypothetical protein